MYRVGSSTCGNSACASTSTGTPDCDINTTGDCYSHNPQATIWHYRSSYRGDGRPRNHHRI